MKTKDYLDEYAGCYRAVDNCSDSIGGVEDCHICKEDKERMQEIEKELEASIRKEVVEDIIHMAIYTPDEVKNQPCELDSRTREELYLKAVGYWECIKSVKEYALSKGIDIK